MTSVRMQVPDVECTYRFVRSGGAGGQKVNKTSSKVVLRWNIGDSKAFTAEQKQRLREYLSATDQDDVVLECDQERSQYQNRRIVKRRLDALVTKALKPIVKRVATKPTRAVKKRRRDEKVRRGQLKKTRREHFEVE